jgi:hypothetical protein
MSAPTPSPSMVEVVVPVVVNEANVNGVIAFCIAIALVAVVFALAGRGR